MVFKLLKTVMSNRFICRSKPEVNNKFKSSNIQETNQTGTIIENHLTNIVTVQTPQGLVLTKMNLNNLNTSF